MANKSNKKQSDKQIPDKANAYHKFAKDMEISKSCIDSNSPMTQEYSSTHAGFGSLFGGGARNFSAGGRTVSSKTDQDLRNKVISVREAYENEGIIGNIIDIMVDFAVEDFEIVHQSNQIQNFYRKWQSTIDLSMLAEQILKSFYRDGNVPILSIRGKISEEAEQRLRRVLGNKLLVDTPREEKLIPIKYAVLDVLSLHKEGSGLLGIEIFEYQINQDDVNMIKSPKTEAQRKLVEALQETLGNNEMDILKKSGRLSISSDRLSMLYYKKDDYRKWAVPMLWRVIGDVRFKRLLRQMDISVAEGVLNSLTIIKLGDTANELPPSKEHYEKMAAMLKNPSKSKQIIWDDLISIESDFPPVEKILGEEKYNQVNNDIRSGLGISEVLVNGTTGQGFSSSFLSVKTLIERLESGRQALSRWLDGEVKLIAKNMGFRQPPVVKLNKMSLSDEELEKKMLLELADRNVISVETLLSRFGEDLNIEIQRMTKEDRIRKEVQKENPFVLLKTGKFGPVHSNGPITILDIAGNENTQVQDGPNNQERFGRDGGRPRGDKSPRKQETAPKRPQGQGSKFDKNIYNKACNRFDKAYDIISSCICEVRGYKNKQQLKQKDFDVIYDIVADVVINLTDARSLTENNIKKVLDKKLKVVSDNIIEPYKDDIRKLVIEYKKKNKKIPSKNSMKNIIGIAFTNSYSSS